MELLLKRRGMPSRSILQLLRRYFRSVILILIFTMIGGAGLYSISARTITLENEALFLVSGFYTKLQVNHANVYRLVSAQESDSSFSEELTMAGQTLERDLAKMRGLPISEPYARDMDDLEQLLSRYLEKQQEILARRITSSSSVEGNDAYYELEEIYQAIYDTFHHVYVQVVSVCEQFAARQAQIRDAYLVILGIMVSLLVIRLVLRMHEIDDAITIPVQRLEEDLRSMDLKHFEATRSLDCSPDSCDDINVLIQIYNAMLEKIRIQLAQRQRYVETELALKEQELLNLQMSNELRKTQLSNLHAQINPHFLFNTLNMISQTAYLKDDRETVSLLEITSDLLRYSLDYSDRAVTLRQELEILGHYVTLQEIRFHDRIRFRFDLDESFHDILIPNLILQPLIENSIIHGIGMYRQGAQITIRTQANPEQGTGEIHILDNGVGMDAHTLCLTREKMHSGKVVTGKDGLNNVFLRLALFFDGRVDAPASIWDMRIESEPGAYTDVCIILPLTTPDHVKEFHHVSDPDC